jgi:transcriptional regulator with XRE-family HTH domain
VKEGMIMALGQNILNSRKKNGLSQEQLGEKVNVTRQTISNWELDETAPNPEQLKLLSKALNVSVDDLIDNDLQNVVLSKIKMTEKQTRTIKKILKGFLIGFIIFLIIDIITFIICFFGHYGPFEETKSESASYVIKENI